MIATLDYINRKFAEYNALIFGNRLPSIPMRIGHAKSTLGGVSYKKRRKPDGTYEYYNFRLTISSQFNLSEQEQEDTLIHEMIHLYILSNQIHDTSPHGAIFRKLMNQINHKYGRNIKVMHHTSPGERANDQKIKEHYVCISEFCDGRTGITVAAKTRVFLIWGQLPLYYNLKSYKWYWTTDPFFNRYPHSIKPRIYAIDPHVAAEHLFSATELVKEGNTIKAKK